jgi:hypothetical protein
MSVSRHQNTVLRNTKILSNSSKNVAKSVYLVTILSNEKYILYEIKEVEVGDCLLPLSSDFSNLASYYLKTYRLKFCKAIILPIVLCGCKMSLTKGKTGTEGGENRVLRRIF